MKKSFASILLIVLQVLNMTSLASKLFDKSIGKEVQVGKASESFATNGISGGSKGKC